VPRSEITIKVRAREDYVPVDSLLKIVGNTLSMLRSLDKAVRQHGHAAQWKISAVSLQSPLSLTMSSDDPQSDFVAREYLGALDAIEKSVDIPRERIPFFVLEQAKDMVSVLNDGVAQVTFSTPTSNPIHPTQRLAANVDYLIAPAYEDYASFEGRMETLSIHGRTLFRIYDDLTGHSVSCFFSAERLTEALSLFNSRVAVSGQAKYSRIGRAISIRIDTIRKLEGGVTLEQLNDINITEGIPSEEYIRKLRDAE
jgi:hypothetical protein